MKRRISVVLIRAVLFVGVLWTSGALAADWPMFKRDPARSSISSETLKFPLRPAWRYVAAQPPSPAWPDPGKNLNRLDFDYAPHPVVAGELLCFGSSSDDTVHALDAGTGRPKWRFTTGGPVRFAPQIWQGPASGSAWARRRSGRSRSP